MSQPADTVHQALLMCRTNSYPNIYRVLECLAVLPVTSTEGERSFKQLWLLKTFPRATMGVERLVELALMQCHRQLVIQLVQDQLVHKFARRQHDHDHGEHFSGIESLRLC